MRDQSEKLKEIIRLGAELNNIQDVDILLERILFEARKNTNADAGTIYVRDGDQLIFNQAQNETKQKKLRPGQKLIYSRFKVKINKESIAGYVASTNEILNIPDVYNISSESPYHFDQYYDKKSHYKTTSMLTVPLKTNRGDIIGVLQIINAKDSNGAVVPFDGEDEPYVLHFANTASMILQRAQMTRALILRMISMAELRDPKETGAHVNRVASYAVEIYEQWALRRDLLRNEIDRNRDILRMAAMLHDVGKVAISDLILKKPARFTDQEYEIIKSHTYLGAQLFENKHSEFDEIAALVALTHHENWDGTGYPGYLDMKTGNPSKTDSNGRVQAMRGTEIPIWGRIVALADVYDALSSKRVYKEAWDEKRVLEEIKILSGKKFDPELVDIFFESFDVIKSISKQYPDEE
jgi:HD-GYP domain-containing protein (c-di-GMP phosphodiesterase class II)